MTTMAALATKMSMRPLRRTTSTATIAQLARSLTSSFDMMHAVRVIASGDGIGGIDTPGHFGRVPPRDFIRKSATLQSCRRKLV